MLSLLPTSQVGNLLTLVQPTHGEAHPEETFDHGVLSRLASAFDCVSVTFQLSDPAQERFLELIEGVQDGPSEVLVPDSHADAKWNTSYWQAHWEDRSCCYPETTGDHESVILTTDFYGEREYRASQMAELCDRMECLIVPLTPAGPLDRRLLFWRVEGNRFQERDRLVLTLLRPHLDRILERHDRARRNAPPLTPRETELVVLLAGGLTNRQIARQLRISEGTVRKHLEHVYARLGVTNRVAALAELPDLVETSRLRSWNVI